MDTRSNFDHYVAQHFIKLFADNSGTAYIGNIATNSVLAVSDFSRILGRENWSIDQQIEDNFTLIETRVATALRTVKENPQAIRGLALPTRNALRDFIRLHTARTVGVHEMMNQSAQQTESELRRVAPPQADVSRLGLRDATRPESLMMGLEIANAIDAALRMKGCVALLAPTGQQFILGDEPLANLSSSDNWQFRGGLPNRDTYLWFPLSPNVGLFFGYGIGEILSEGRINVANASTQLTNTLNRAEVFQSVESIIGKTRGFVRNKIRLPNVGAERTQVTALDWAPFMIMTNNVVSPITEEMVDQIRRQV